MIGTTAIVPAKRDARIAGLYYLLMGVGTGIGIGATVSPAYTSRLPS